MLDWQHRVTYSFVKDREQTESKQRCQRQRQNKGQEQRKAYSFVKDREQKQRTKMTETRTSKLALSDIVAGDIIQSVS